MAEKQKQQNDAVDLKPDVVQFLKAGNLTKLADYLNESQNIITTADAEKVRAYILHITNKYASHYRKDAAYSQAIEILAIIDEKIADQTEEPKYRPGSGSSNT